MVFTLFKGDKTSIFWAGLIILSLASVVMFSILWEVRHYAVLSQGLEYNVPPMVGAIVFILLGLFMMKSGVKREQPLSKS